MASKIGGTRTVALVADSSVDLDLDIPRYYRDQTVLVVPVDDGSGGALGEITVEVFYFVGAAYYLRIPNPSARLLPNRASSITMCEGADKVRLRFHLAGSVLPSGGVLVQPYGLRY